MTTKQVYSKRSFWIQCIMLLFITSCISLFSCKNKEKGKEDPFAGFDKKTLAKYSEAQKSDILSACMTLSADAFRVTWEDPNLVSRISYLVLHTNFDHISGTYSVQVEAFDNTHSAITGKVTTKGSPACVKFPSIAIGDNIIDISKLKIVDPQGTKFNPFNYIKLEAYPYPDNKTYLSYKVWVISDSESYELEGGSLPCPPCINCKRCPEICENKCDSTVHEEDLTPKQ